MYIENKSNVKFDIYERSIKFAVKMAKVIRALEKDMVLNEYTKQLVRSSSSIDANLTEADGALTRKDFIHKIGIARKEAKETNYWLQLINSLGLKNYPELQDLQKESKEIMLILSSIIIKTQNRL